MWVNNSEGLVFQKNEFIVSVIADSYQFQPSNLVSPGTVQGPGDTGG